MVYSYTRNHFSVPTFSLTGTGHIFRALASKLQSGYVESVIHRGAEGRTIMVAYDVGRRVMGQGEQRDTTRGQREEDPRRFEKTTREVREEQSPNPGEEGTEEDRQQWENPRDIGEETAAIPEEANEDRLEAPPGD